VDRRAGGRPREVVRVSGQELVPVLVDRTGSSSPTPRRFCATWKSTSGAAAVAARRGAAARRRTSSSTGSTGSGSARRTSSPAGPRPGQVRPAHHGVLDLFESLLDGRDYLLGEFGIADVTAFPFVKYATDKNPTTTRTSTRSSATGSRSRAGHASRPGSPA
jgi:glutathione S-transferase